jgi:peptidyl-prolyl cis-trans isomerase A (cyclophilin A)
MKSLSVSLFSSLLLTGLLSAGAAQAETAAAAKPAATETKTEAKKDEKKAEKAPAAKDDKAAAAAAAKDTKPAGSPVVEMKTSMGTIKIALDEKAAPETVKNFLGYVDAKFYDGTIFHRVIKDFMIQGGGYSAEGGKFTEKPTKSPIKNEGKNGLKNDRGTIAMARTGDPDSATAQFFINHVDNDNLNYPKPDGHGYAVFGKVTEGMDVVDKIAAVKTGLKNGMADVPEEDVKIISVTLVKPNS